MVKINLSYKINHKLIPEFYQEVIFAYCLATKNIKNSTLFLIKNVLSSYIYNKESNAYFIKPELHTNQKEILQLLNQAIKKLKLFKPYESTTSERNRGLKFMLM